MLKKASIEIGDFVKVKPVSNTHATKACQSNVWYKIVRITTGLCYVIEVSEGDGYYDFTSNRYNLVNIDDQDIIELKTSTCDEEKEALRFNTNKTQTREIDPDFIMGIGEVLTACRVKYPEGNWMTPTKYSTSYESLMRHLMAFWSGKDYDEETKKQHLLHAATNIMFLYYQVRNHPEKDDRLFKGKK